MNNDLNKQYGKIFQNVNEQVHADHKKEEMKLEYPEMNKATS